MKLTGLTPVLPKFKKSAEVKKNQPKASLAEQPQINFGKKEHHPKKSTLATGLMGALATIGSLIPSSAAAATMHPSVTETPAQQRSATNAAGDIFFFPMAPGSNIPERMPQDVPITPLTSDDKLAVVIKKDDDDEDGDHHNPNGPGPGDDPNINRIFNQLHQGQKQFTVEEGDYLSHYVYAMQSAYPELSKNSLDELVAQVAEANNISNPDFVREGQVIDLSTILAPIEASADYTRWIPEGFTGPILSVDDAGINLVIRDGNTLSETLEVMLTNPADKEAMYSTFAQSNNIQDINKIQAGKSYTITPETAAFLSQSYYITETRNTLSHAAETFKQDFSIDLSNGEIVALLADFNGIANPNRVEINQEIKAPLSLFFNSSRSPAAATSEVTGNVVMAEEEVTPVEPVTTNPEVAGALTQLDSQEEVVSTIQERTGNYSTALVQAEEAVATEPEAQAEVIAGITQSIEADLEATGTALTEANLVQESLTTQKEEITAQIATLSQAEASLSEESEQLFADYTLQLAAVEAQELKVTQMTETLTDNQNKLIELQAQIASSETLTEDIATITGQINEIYISLDTVNTQIAALQAELQEEDPNAALRETLNSGLLEVQNAINTLIESGDAYDVQPLYLHYPDADMDRDPVITRGFGLEFHPIHHEDRMHNGIDLSAKHGVNDGDEVLSTISGRVVLKPNNGGAGNTVDIYSDTDGDGVEDVLTRNFHLQDDSFMVNDGDFIEPGTPIARVGSTGGSTGPHLHFELHILNDAGEFEPVDPLAYLEGDDRIPLTNSQQPTADLNMLIIYRNGVEAQLAELPDSTNNHAEVEASLETLNTEKLALETQLDELEPQLTQLEADQATLNSIMPMLIDETYNLEAMIVTQENALNLATGDLEELNTAPIIGQYQQAQESLTTTQQELETQSANLVVTEEGQQEAEGQIMALLQTQESLEETLVAAEALAEETTAAIEAKRTEEAAASELANQIGTLEVGTVEGHVDAMTQADMDAWQARWPALNPNQVAQTRDHSIYNSRPDLLPSAGSFVLNVQALDMYNKMHEILGITSESNTLFSYAHGYRSPEFNEAVEGAAHNHPFGTSFDVDVNGGDAERANVLAAAQQAGFNTFGVGSHRLHIQYRDGSDGHNPAIWNYNGVSSDAEARRIVENSVASAEVPPIEEAPVEEAIATETLEPGNTANAMAAVNEYQVSFSPDELYNNWLKHKPEQQWIPGQVYTNNNDGKYTGEYTNTEFRELTDGVFQIASELNINPDELMADMHLETGGTYSPGVVNVSGATGLIQFVGDTRIGLVQTVDGISMDREESKAFFANMSITEQLRYVKAFLQGKPNLSTPGNLRVGIIWPAAADNPGSDVVWVNGGRYDKIYDGHTGFDKNKDGQTTVAELRQYGIDNMVTLLNS